MMVEHGRRSAQKQAYLAAGAGPPTSFHQVAARRRHQQQSPPEASFVGGNLVDSNVADLLGSTGEAFPRSPMRAVPAGRGLSREASSQNKFRDPGASSGAGGADDGFGLSGISLSSSMNLGERPPPLRADGMQCEVDMVPLSETEQAPSVLGRVQSHWPRYISSVMEADYKPKGWLGLILGSRLW